MKVVEFYHRVIRNADTRLVEKKMRIEGSGSGSSEDDASGEGEGSATFTFYRDIMTDNDGYVLMETLE